MKKLIGLFLLITIMLSGCYSKPGASSIAADITKTKQDTNPDVKAIPYKYVFTGFVSVKDVDNGLPVDTKVFRTEEEWKGFKDKYLPYETIPNPSYSVESIDFKNNVVVYSSMLDAKAEVYAQAWQIDKIVLEEQQINLISRSIDGQLKITTGNINEKQDLHRYVVIVTIDKNDFKAVGN